MRIIAVNINKTLASGVSAFNATERAWKLNERKFLQFLPEFVIGVASGKAKEHFRLVSVNSDIEPKRLKFSLKPCLPHEISEIEAFVKNKNLKYFVVKYKW